MLLGHFFTILEFTHQESVIRVKVEFNAEHPIFKGHFPNLPVVPGVCQTQMLIETMSYVLGRKVELKIATHIKFLALLNPVKNKVLDMEIKIEKEALGILHVSATYTAETELFFRFKGELN